MTAQHLSPFPSLRFLLASLLACGALLLAVRPAQAQAPGDLTTTPSLRIITGAPNLTEIVFALGAGPNVVGVSTYCNYPPHATALPRVADLFSPNLEAMVRLEPTLIIGLESQDKIFSFFEGRPGVEALKMGELETLEQIGHAITRIGRALGREQQARRLLAAQPTPRPLPAAADRPRVLWVVGHGPALSQLYAVGHGTYLHELLEQAGALNVVPADAGKYPVLNKEALLRLRPEIIVYTAEPGTEGERLREARREWAPLRTLPAVQRGDFRFLLGKDALVPGPRAHHLLPLLQQLLLDGEPGSTAGPLPAEGEKASSSR